MANNPYINKVRYGNQTLIDLTADTVTASDMLSGVTAHDGSGAPITGSIVSKSATTYTPTTADQTISSGQYLAGTQTIEGDVNLVAGNIKRGASIFGVSGTFSGFTDGVYYVEGSGSVAAVTTSPYYAAQWKGTSANITSLYTGLTIIYKLDVAGNGTYGTVLDINSLGAHPVVRNVSSMVGTSYPVSTAVVMTYDADLTGSAYINDTEASTIQGVWNIGDAMSTSIYQLRKNSGGLTVKSTAGSLYRYELCMSDMNGQLIPFNNTSNARTTYTKAMNSEAFDPFGTIYWYYTTTTVSAGATASAASLYRQLAYDIRYAMNINSSGTSGTTALTSSAPVYLRVLYDPSTGLSTFTQDVSNASYLERSSVVQEFPISDPQSGRTDDKFYLYIYLGQAYSKYQMELSIDHPIYYWDSVLGGIRRYLGQPTTSQINALIDARLGNQ